MSTLNNVGKKKKDDHQILGVKSQREKRCLQQKSWWDHSWKDINDCFYLMVVSFLFFNMDDILEQTFVKIQSLADCLAIWFQVILMRNGMKLSSYFIVFKSFLYEYWTGIINQLE